MFGISQPYSGNFYFGEWIEYNSSTKEYGVPKSIRYKPQELGASDVSGSTNEQTLVYENNKKIIKYKMTIQVLGNNDYKPVDKFRLSNGQMYTIIKINPAIDSVNAMANLMFPNQKNTPTVLYLGSE